MTSPVFHFGPEPFTPLLIVISGPSGIGKDAVVQALRVKNPNTHFVITMTSRLPRAEEQDGVDYFVSRQEFEALICLRRTAGTRPRLFGLQGIPRQQVRQAL